MAWVTRGNRRYYYQSIRVGRRITKVYLGSGPEADQAAAAVEQRRAEHAAQAETLHREQQAHADAAAPLTELCHLSDLLMRATLISQGYHQHSRGEWSRRRQAKHQEPLPHPDLPTRAEGDPRTSQPG